MVHGIASICYLGPGEALSQGLPLIRMLLVLLGAGGNEALVRQTVNSRPRDHQHLHIGKAPLHYELKLWLNVPTQGMN